MGKIFESTPAYQKGLIGEEIVKKFLESHGDLVRRPDDVSASGASRVDFFVEQPVISEEYEWTYNYYAEVKVKSPQSYSYGRFQVYAFPKSLIESYKNYSKEKDLDIELFIVDELRESIFWIGDIKYIDYPVTFEDKTFPVEIEQQNGIYLYFNVEIFSQLYKIDFTDLERLRTIKFSAKDNKKIFKPLSKSDVSITSEKLLLESQAIIKKFLDISLPNDLPTKIKKIVALVESLRNILTKIPTCYFYEIYHAVHNLNIEYDMSVFISQFYPLLDSIKHERKKNSYGKIETIEIKSSAKKFSELRTPDNILIEILQVADNDLNFFVSDIQLSEALGYGKHSVRYHSSLGNSIKIASKFYRILGYSEDKFGIDIIPVKDISAIIEEHSFYREDDIAKYETAKNFLIWWKKVSLPYMD